MRVSVYKVSGYKITMDDSKLPSGKDFPEKLGKAQKIVSDYISRNGIENLSSQVEELWQRKTS